MERARDNPQGASASEMIEKKRKKAALMRAITGDADIQITGCTIRLQQMSPAMLREMADEADRRAQRDRDRSDYY